MDRPFRPVDFTVGAFIVHDNKVLMIDHKKIGQWLCIGGHVEENEDPITA
jgi:8-oxo-dGTP diphosphatase